MAEKAFLVTLDTGKKIVFRDEQTMHAGLKKIAEANFDCGYDDVEHDDHEWNSGFVVIDGSYIKVFVEVTCVADDGTDLAEFDEILADVDELDYVG